jgi:hypothetical protein
MVLSGMIFQFDSDQGIGLIMLSDGETKEFSTREWVDASHLPKVGLKISYDTSEHFKKIKCFSEEESISNDVKTNENSTDPLVSVDDHIAYYKERGFKLASDSIKDDVRVVSLRSYSMDDYGEVSIKYSDSKLDITVMMNGKKVFS